MDDLVATPARVVRMERGIDAHPSPARDAEQVLPLGQMLAALNSRQRRRRDADLLGHLADGQPLAAASSAETITELDRVDDHLKGRGAVGAVGHLFGF